MSIRHVNKNSEIASVMFADFALVVVFWICCNEDVMKD